MENPLLAGSFLLFDATLFTMPVEIFEHAPFTFVGPRERITFEGIRDYYHRAFSAAYGAINAAGAQPAGAAIGFYFQPPGTEFDLAAAFPVADARNVDPALVHHFPGARVAKTVHQGSYDGLPQAWERFVADLTQRGETPGNMSWEEYVTMPQPGGDPEALITHLFCTLS
ncbi:GyrI-like domain-containing protein [Corynebacterium gerontici]|uniref:Bacterial transcription activator, effector binding domain n=1 Tax=Corynebacterium gerontici TaxID=2079234 RepID=A0A3G6IYH6_9CORY|nr:GyrI-like domain-containing protein [Corynebacterium gerontici]AZA10831.1 Bacterial transcription activator, effector binding domain [Corynebacterium gerontici]